MVILTEIGTVSIQEIHENDDSINSRLDNYFSSLSPLDFKTICKTKLAVRLKNERRA